MPPHIGGIELVADSLFHAYRASGFDVRWVAARAPAGAPAREDGRIRVACWNWLERKLGVPWPILGLEGIREINRLVGWADLLHVHDSLYEAGAAVLVARRARKPVIVSQHIGFVKYQNALLNGIEHLANGTLGRTVLRRATHVVFCTRAAEQFAEPVLKGRSGRTSFIPNGIDINVFKPPTPQERLSARRNLNIPDSTRVALFVGRLVEKKGVDVLVELTRAMPSYHFLIAGNGPLGTMVPTGAPNVSWFPAVAPAAMVPLYRAADVFLLPSHGEGLPLSVQEAMATGMPVIVSRDEVFTEMFEGQGACIAAERTASGFRDSLEQLVEDSGLGDRLGARARDLAVREWSLELMTDRYDVLIRELMETRQTND
jgi:glycosyltransferase involved in cell wall biosynthesis